MKLVSGGGSKNAFISTIGVDVRTHQIDLSEGHSCKLQASIRINWIPVLISIIRKSQVESLTFQSMLR